MKFSDIDGSKEIDDFCELEEVIPAQGVWIAKNVTGTGTRNYWLYLWNYLCYF